MPLSKHGPELKNSGDFSGLAGSDGFIMPWAYIKIGAYVDSRTMASELEELLL